MKKKSNWDMVQNHVHSEETNSLSFSALESNRLQVRVLLIRSSSRFDYTIGSKFPLIVVLRTPSLICLLSGKESSSGLAWFRFDFWSVKMGANDIDMEEGTLEIGMGKPPLITDHTLYWASRFESYLSRTLS